MKTILRLTPGQALAQALLEAAESCRVIREEVQTAKGRRSGRTMERLTRSANRLNKQLTQASRLLETVIPGVTRPQNTRDPIARRRLSEATAAAIDREVSAANALYEEATGTTANAESAARLLNERQEGIHRRIDRLASRGGHSVSARARRAHGRIEFVVQESNEFRTEQHRASRARV